MIGFKETATNDINKHNAIKEIIKTMEAIYSEAGYITLLKNCIMPKQAISDKKYHYQNYQYQKFICLTGGLLFY